MGGIRIKSTSQVSSQSGPTVLQRQRASGADFGSELFSGAEQLAQQITLKAQDRANRANFLDVTNQMDAWTQKEVYGQEGYLATSKGKNAFGGSDKILKDFDAFTETLSPEMKNETQKQAFAQAVMAKRSELQKTTAKHEASEFHAYSQNQDIAAIGNAKVNMANNYRSPEIMLNEMTRLTSVVLANGQSNGFSDEQIQANLLTEKSGAISGVVNRALADNDYGLAKDLFNANKNNLLPDERDRLQKSIDIGNNRAISQASADRIMNMGLTQQDALKEARSIADPEVRDNTVARVKARYGEIEQVNLAQTIKTSSDIATQIDNGEEINIPQLSGLDDASRSALTRYQTKIMAGDVIETDPVTKTDLEFMMNDNPGSFIKTNLYAYRDKLSNKDFNAYLDNQKKAIEVARSRGKAGKEFSPKSLFSDSNMVKNAAGEFGIIDNTKTAAKQSSEEKKRYFDFQQMVDNELMSEQEKKGEALTDAEKQSIINRAAARFTIKVKEDGWIFDSDKQLGELTEEEIESGDYYLSDEIERERIAKSLMDQNKEPTRENVIKERIERNRLKGVLLGLSVEPTEQNIIYAKSKGL